MSRTVGVDLVERFPLEQIQRQRAYWPYRPESKTEAEGGIGRNPPGFLRRCIEQDLAPPPAWLEAEGESKRALLSERQRAREEAARMEREILLDRINTYWETLEEEREEIERQAAERLKARSDWWRQQAKRGGHGWTVTVTMERQEIIAEQMGIVLPK